MAANDRGGGEDTNFEAKDSKKVRGQDQDRVSEDRLPRGQDRKARGQGQGLDDTFENTRKYKCKYCRLLYL